VKKVRKSASRAKKNLQQKIKQHENNTTLSLSLSLNSFFSTRKQSSSRKKQQHYYHQNHHCFVER
tara:strand:+ start:114 stop:308 length:195 start_codon:yes stop_codon:yes gene_type:complete